MRGGGASLKRSMRRRRPEDFERVRLKRSIGVSVAPCLCCCASVRMSSDDRPLC